MAASEQVAKVTKDGVAWKQGLGFILSLVTTLNIINIIKYIIVPQKHMHGRHYSEIILSWIK